MYHIYYTFQKTTAAQNEIALSYHEVRVQYCMAVIFAATIVVLSNIYIAILFLHNSKENISVLQSFIILFLSEY